MVGINPRLFEALKAVDTWCQSNNIDYDIACDESDIQCVRLFQKNRTLINKLLEHLQDTIAKNRVHLETQKVRGGTIIAFSLEALAEAVFQSIVKQIGEEIEAMTFEDKIADAFSKKVVVTKADPKPEPPRSFTEDELVLMATKIIYGEQAVPSKPVQETTKPRKKTLAFEQRVAEAFDTTISKTRSQFNRQLSETLGGIATPTGQQPSDLFTKFSKALRVLGDQMGVGPLQDRLKEQGINWKKSDDGQSIILYIVNGQTNATQPIARISAQTLEQPSDFEEQLTNMLDFAKGDAPGAFKQKQEELQNQQKAVRDIAKAVSPQDAQNPAAQAMNGGVATTPQIQTPNAKPQGQAIPAPVAATQQAASPKV